MAPIRRPTRLRLAEGAAPSKVNNAEPIAPDEQLNPPYVLDDDTAEVWAYTVRQLDHMRIASSADRDALYAYCVAVVANRESADALRERGLIIRGSNGPAKNPAWQTWRDSCAVIRYFAQEFGLTPSGRTRIQVKGAGDDQSTPFEGTG